MLKANIYFNSIVTPQDNKNREQKGTSKGIFLKTKLLQAVYLCYMLSIINFFEKMRFLNVSKQTRIQPAYNS